MCIHAYPCLSCIPVTILLEKICLNRIPPLRILLTLLPLLVGVCIGTVNDVSINFPGTAYALLAVFAASLAQIYTSSVQKELNCNALQLLCHTSPLIVLQMAAAMPVFHDVNSILKNSEPSVMVIWRILLSCVLAFGVNMTNYMILGLTSPLTYQVLGHLKTILILIIGSLTFNTIPTPTVAAGMSLAVFGGKYSNRMKSEY